MLQPGAFEPKAGADKDANTPGDIDVAADGPAIRVFVVHIQEDWQIALECFWLAECRL